MPLDPANNLAETELTASVSDTATTLPVADASVFPDADSEGAFNVLVWDSEANINPSDAPDAEFVRVTGVDTTADELTVERGQEDTGASAKESGSTVTDTWSVKDRDDIDSALNGKADDPHGNEAHTSTFAVDGDPQPPEEHGDTEHDDTVPSQSDVDSKADDPHGNAAHSETFAVDGDAQPPEEHGDTEHDETVPSQSDVDSKADDPHGSESHSSEVVHEGEDATLGDTTHDSVSTDVLNSADLTAGAEGDALTLTDNPPALALGTTGAELITQDAEPPVTDEGEAIWAQFVVDGTEATGAEQDWQHELHSSTVNSVSASDGVVYSGGSFLDETVIAADASDGSEIWQHELHTSPVRSVSASDGVVYSGSDDETVIAADASDGTEIWQHELHTRRVNSVFESDGVVYSGSSDNTVIAADASDGTEIWQHELHTDRVNSVSPSDGAVYSGSDDETVIAADASDGTEIWQHELHTGTVYSVFESDGVVYSGSSDETVIAADASDGTEIWQHELHTLSVNSVFESDGAVYSGSDDDTVIAAGLLGAETFYQLHISDGTEWIPVRGQQ